MTMGSEINKYKKNMCILETVYNVLTDKCLIDIPPVKSLRKAQFFINLNDKSMNNIKSKSTIDETLIKYCQSTGGGNSIKLLVNFLIIAKFIILIIVKIFPL